MKNQELEILSYGELILSGLSVILWLVLLAQDSSWGAGAMTLVASGALTRALVNLSGINSPVVG